MIALELAVEHGGLVRVPSESITTFTLLWKFHALLGEPSYGTGVEFERILFEHAARMLGVARDARRCANDPLDIPISVGMSHIPCVPSWTVSQITLLRAQERVDPWIGEKYWLRERVQDANRAGKDLSDLISAVAVGDWYPDVRS